MKTTYRSKIDITIILFTITILGLSAFPIILAPHPWIGFAILLCVTVFIIYSFSSTYYMISDNTLYINSGWGKPIEIDILHINKIKETNNMLSAPATSLDRLEIYYNNHSQIMISPQRKIDFLKQIKEINPSITIHYINNKM